MTTRQVARAERARGRRRVGSLVVVAGLVVLAVIGAGLAFRSVAGGPDDFTGTGQGRVEVVVPEGASITRIGQVLEDAGVVASSGAFVAAAQTDDRARSIGPGTYAMSLGMSAQSALDRLLDPQSRVVARVVVPEGSTVREIVDRIVAATPIPRADLEALVEDPSPLPLPAYAKDRLEGFLYPATYEVDPDDTATTVLTAMVQRFLAAAIEVDLEDRAEKAGLDPYDVVIAASLVEAEVRPEDFGKAARVIDNRLDAGMRLQFDSTINYAKGTSDITLSSDDLALDSPFNTYRITGLPPTPIGSPSSAAIDAVLDPDDGDWIYFVTVDPATGRTEFTASYEEFLRLKDEFQATQS